MEDNFHTYLNAARWQIPVRLIIIVSQGTDPVLILGKSIIWEFITWRFGSAATCIDINLITAVQQIIKGHKESEPEDIENEFFNIFLWKIEYLV